MSEELKPCPFCGCKMRFESNRDTHKIIGDHYDFCIFDADQVIVEVPASDEHKEWALSAWNRRYEV